MTPKTNLKLERKLPVIPKAVKILSNGLKITPR